MKYSKKALSFKQQAELLISRGLVADNETLIKCLESVNYYRLSAYWYIFLQEDDTFQEGTSFDTIWRRYRFDRRLRIHIMDAIERVEVAIRSQLTNLFSQKYDAFAYLDNSCLPNLSETRHCIFLEKLNHEIKRSKEKFIDHFFSKYGDKHKNLPLWMAVELIPFGMTFTLYKAVDDDIKKTMASKYNISDTVMESWLKTLNTIRNICAHHSRLWNRELGCKPTIPRKRKHQEWHIPSTPQNSRIFATILILKYLMNYIAPQSGWAQRIEDLLDEFNDIPLLSMGFPDNWKKSPIWSKKMKSATNE